MPVFTISVSDDAYAGLVDVVGQFLQQGQQGQLSGLARRGSHQALDAAPVSERGIARSASIAQVAGGPPRPVMRTASIPRILDETQRAVNGVIELAETMGEDINDLQEMRNDVDGMRGDVDGVREAVDDVRGDVTGMREEVDKIPLVVGDVENLIRKVQALEEENRKRGAVQEAQEQPLVRSDKEQATVQTQVLVTGPKQRAQDVDVNRYAQKVENMMLFNIAVCVIFIAGLAYASVIVFGPGLVIVCVGLIFIVAMLLLRGYRFSLNL